MRLFVAVWPSREVVDVLDGLDRPGLPSVRWTTRAQWHVTLRFLGEVADDDIPALVDALDGPSRLASRVVHLGPATCRLGRHALVVPVAGVDDLAGAVADASRPFGPPRDDHPFTGHLTLARGRGGHPVPPSLAGREVQAAWLVDSLALVRSRVSSAGARYETIATLPLDNGECRQDSAVEPDPAEGQRDRRRP